MKWGPPQEQDHHQQQQHIVVQQQQHQEQHYLDPSRLTSALQILTTVSRQHHQRDDSHDSHTDLRDLQQHDSSSTDPSSFPPLGKTIVASDNEVSNGFVKEGRRLPYVFEATESGEDEMSTFMLSKYF